MSVARLLRGAALAAALAPGLAPGQEPAPVPGLEEAHARVAGVTLLLPPQEEPGRAALESLIAVTPGDELSPRALRRTVQLLWQKGRCRNVRVRERSAEAPPGAPAAPWVSLEIECLPVRRLRRVEVAEQGTATPALDAPRREGAAGLRVGEPWEDADLPGVRERVAAAYARRGWRAAEVEGEATGDADVALRLTVRPGTPTRVARVSLEGEGAATAAALLGTLRTRAGEVLDEEALAEDGRALAARLRGAGRRRAQVAAPQVVETEAGVEVVFRVDAGPAMRLTVRGGRSFPTAQLEAALGLGPEDSFDAPSLELAASRLRAFYGARGFAAAAVRWRETASRGGVLVAMRVDEGRRYRV